MRARYWLVVCLFTLLSACGGESAHDDGGTDANTQDGGDAVPDGGDTLPDGGDYTPIEGLFVHASAGQDLPENGTMDLPFKSIAYAIEQATAPNIIHVAAGSYEESIELKNRVSLLGGYHAQNWSDRDNRAWDDPDHRTAILATSGIGIVVGTGVGEDTLLDGFYVEGGIETHDHHSHGMYIYDGASPVIRNNKIHGGHGDTYSSGISTFSDAAPAILRNVVLGGDAPYSYALRLGETTSLVANNLLLGQSGTEESYGVLVNNASPVIVNNTIDGGSATTAYGLFLFVVAAPEIRNNIVFADGATRGYGIYEATMTADAAEVHNNNFFACTTALYHDWGGTPTDITDIADLEALTDTNASGNKAVDPRFLSPTDRHLQESSPT
ncbi:MAG: right-handed parallel beta-helix repeat-containing protein, partial [Lentisphaeria bacterium]|nr:right-handed parallel beta-helix repeat-containing protein [Lentisphaeria bacterium]